MAKKLDEVIKTKKKLLELKLQEAIINDNAVIENLKKETVVENEDIFSPIVVVRPGKPIDPIGPIEPVEPDYPSFPIDPGDIVYPGEIIDPEEPDEEPELNDLTFSGENPVIITRNGDADNIFDSIRTSSCDVNIVSKDLLTDLYTAKKDDVIMEIVVDGNVEWQGYLTPNSFSQPLTQNLDQIAMTAIDPIALMKYVTIDKILTRPNVLTYKELIGKALAYVMLDQNYLYVEETVRFDQDENVLLDLMVQVNNFWDEGGEPMTCYDMIAEMLRPFGLTLIFSGQAYFIYDMTKSNKSFNRWFSRYKITPDGELINAEHSIQKVVNTLSYGTDYKANNVSNSNISIPSTYDKVTGEASTQIPEYSSMAKDKVKPENRDQYDAAWFNIQRNKMHGPDGTGKIDNSDAWQFIWNGVWIDPDYNLTTETQVNGFSNIQAAYRYIGGTDYHPEDYGSILNFYGSASNPVGTDKVQPIERSVEVKDCITTYAPDNGIPMEFLDKEDFAWNYSYDDGGEEGYPSDSMHKVDANDPKWGKAISSYPTRISYHQKYENMTLIEESDQTLSFALTQAYSRTGFKDRISISSLAEVENTTWVHKERWDESYEDWWIMTGGRVYQCPWLWNASAVGMEYTFWNRYFSKDYKMECVYDRRRIDVYVNTPTGCHQFNGKEWVECDGPSAENAFYLVQLLNDTNKKGVFNNDMKYDMIECSDGTIYSLSDEAYVYTEQKKTQSGREYWVFHGMGSTSGLNYRTTSRQPYLGANSDWRQWVNKSDKGEFEIVLPRVDAVNTDVCVDVWTSNLLGTTGMVASGGAGTYSITFNVYDESTDRYWASRYDCDYNFLPVNCSYFKAEHLDIDISVTVPESNLGQMFNTSDIKYQLDLKKNYLLQYEGPTFKVNTYHPLVSASFSYLIYEGSTADAEKFVINGQAARPEAYVVNAYLNYLSKIRRRYEKTIVPLNGRKVSNMLTFIDAPEVTNNNLVSEGEYLVVTTDSWDVKTDRHTIQAVECYDMDVDEVRSVPVIEIPRKARNDRFNYPSSIKNF